VGKRLRKSRNKADLGAFIYDEIKYDEQKNDWGSSMKNILVYGDSNTWGLNPEWMKTGVLRHGADVRWTGRLQAALGDGYRIIEEGLNGRTTVFNDPTSPGRRGADFLEVCIESHSPLDLIVVILGTNDTKTIFNANEVEITRGLGQLIRAAKNPFLYGADKIPEILIGAPVPLGGGIASRQDVGMLDGVSVAKSQKLTPHYKALAEMLNCHFIDLGQAASASAVDHVHLDADAHAKIAAAMETKIMEILGG
jgi:lysophospholipase L1-like esterase